MKRKGWGGGGGRAGEEVVTSRADHWAGVVTSGAEDRAGVVTSGAEDRAGEKVVRAGEDVITTRAEDRAGAVVAGGREYPVVGSPQTHRGGGEAHSLPPVLGQVEQAEEVSHGLQAQGPQAWGDFGALFCGLYQNRRLTVCFVLYAP